MPYIGNIPAEKYASFEVQHFTTSATTSYTLTHAVANELDIRLVINNVIQQPGGSYAYTASGTTLTLSAATAGTDTMYAVYIGKAVQTVNPPAGSVDLTSTVTGTLPIANGGTGSTATTFVNATTNITGVVPAANLGTGTASSSTVLYGDGTFKAEPGGTLIEIAEANVTSNVGSYFFSNVFSSTYDSYFLDLRKLRFSSDAQLQMRLLSNSTTGEFSGAYYQYAFYGLDATNNEERDFGNGDTKWNLGKTQDADSSSDGGITGNMYFYNPFANNSSSINTVGQFAYRDNSNIFNGINFAGNYSGTAARYGFVLFGSQNINQLQATLYGIVK